MSEEVLIMAARRTPIGAFLGALSSVHAAQLGAVVTQAVLEDADLAGARLSGRRPRRRSDPYPQ